MNTLISFIKATVKIVAKLALALVALGLVAVISYYSYQNYEEKQALAFSAHPDWVCSVLEGDYQSCINDQYSFIRKIDQENNSQILVSIIKNSEGEKRYVVNLFWNEECVPGSIIVTDLEFSDGTKRELSCFDAAWGTALTNGASLSRPPTNIEFSFGGFDIDESFYTDMSWLERRFTLSEVRSSDEIEEEEIATEEEQRLAAEAIAEEERLAAIARVEQERVAAEARAEEERLAAERENDRLECEAVEDEREADFYRRYDNLANDIQVTQTCRFDGTEVYSDCYPNFTIRNNSRFTIENLTIGYGNIISGVCANIITQHTMRVSTEMKPGQSLNANGNLRLRYPDGQKICTSINNVTVDGGRNYPRNSCN